MITSVDANQINAQANLTFNGTVLSVTGSITSTGDMTANTSDRRLKTIFGKIDNALDKIDKINGIYYEHNELAREFGYVNEKRQVGLIAQEVDEVLPEVIALAPIDNDGYGHSKSGENYLTIKYDRLVPLLVECIKELKLEIEELKNKLQ